MSSSSYRRHRFPAAVIQHAVWLYFRFPLSLRDVEDMLSQRGIDVSYETVRRWSSKFGLAYARKLRRSHPRADTRWHLDEVFVSINGKNVYLWRAVDCEGEVLDVLVQSRRGIVTLSEIGPIWTIDRQAKPLKSHASKSAAVGKFQSIRLNVTTPSRRWRRTISSARRRRRSRVQSA